MGSIITRIKHTLGYVDEPSIDDLLIKFFPHYEAQTFSEIKEFNKEIENVEKKVVKEVEIPVVARTEGERGTKSFYS